MGTLQSNLARRNAALGKPPGHLSKYKPEYISTGRMLAEAGATNHEIADYLKISISTFTGWMLRYPDFAEAVRTGKFAADDRMEASLYHRGLGQVVTKKDIRTIKERDKAGHVVERVVVTEYEEQLPSDTASMIFWLKNRRSNDWKERHEHRVDLGSLTDEQLEQRFKRIVAPLIDGEYSRVDK